MDWVLIITSEDLGWRRGTPERLRELISRLPRDATVLKALHFAAALGVDKANSYRTVDERLLRGAPKDLIRRIEILRRASPNRTFIYFAPWPHLLLPPHAARY